MAADTLLAGILFVGSVVSSASTVQYTRSVDPTFRPLSPAVVLASMLLLSLPLALRRRLPLTTAGTVVAAFLFNRVVLDVDEESMTVLVGSFALYSAAAHGEGRSRVPVLSVCVSVIVAEVVREIYFGVPAVAGKVLTQGFIVFYNLVLLAMPCALGSLVRTLRQRQRELAERSRQLEVEREENARRAVFDERVRIARELHDVVAHHVSVMGVQAGAARLVMEREPVKAAEALAGVEVSSRQAVVELHRLLGFLRREGETDDLAPQPSLRQLDGLVAQMAGADLAVELVVDGEPLPLPPTVELSAYRIVQEALTNTLKHASASQAEVHLRYRPGEVEVEVVDDGLGGSGAPAGAGGHGLIGMRERVGLHGGRLIAGPRPEGGFAVRATFPVDGGAP